MEVKAGLPPSCVLMRRSLGRSEGSVDEMGRLLRYFWVMMAFFISFIELAAFYTSKDIRKPKTVSSPENWPHF